MNAAIDNLNEYSVGKINLRNLSLKDVNIL
jgi:hypothetical protein